MSKTAVELLMTFILLAFIMVIDEADGNGKGGLKLFGNQHLPKIRHARGKYSTKEEVMKKIEHDHPCKLTQTAVKITFPGRSGLSKVKGALGVSVNIQHRIC